MPTVVATDNSAQPLSSNSSARSRQGAAWLGSPDSERLTAARYSITESASALESEERAMLFGGKQRLHGHAHARARPTKDGAHQARRKAPRREPIDGLGQCDIAHLPDQAPRLL